MKPVLRPPARNYAEEFARRSGIEIDISAGFALSTSRRHGSTPVPCATRIPDEHSSPLWQQPRKDSCRHRRRNSQPGDTGLRSRDSEEVLENFKTSGKGVGLGLAGLRERLREVDGKFDLSSTTDGTILRVSLLVTKTCEPYEFLLLGDQAISRTPNLPMARPARPALEPARAGNRKRTDCPTLVPFIPMVSQCGFATREKRHVEFYEQLIKNDLLRPFRDGQFGPWAAIASIPKVANPLGLDYGEELGSGIKCCEVALSSGRR